MKLNCQKIGDIDLEKEVPIFFESCRTEGRQLAARRGVANRQSEPAIRSNVSCRAYLARNLFMKRGSIALIWSMAHIISSHFQGLEVEMIADSLALLSAAQRELLWKQRSM